MRVHPEHDPSRDTTRIPSPAPDPDSLPDTLPDPPPDVAPPDPEGYQDVITRENVPLSPEEAAPRFVSSRNLPPIDPERMDDPAAGIPRITGRNKNPVRDNASGGGPDVDASSDPDALDGGFDKPDTDDTLDPDNDKPHDEEAWEKKTRKEILAETMSQSQAAKEIGITRKRMKAWFTQGKVEGGQIVQGQLRIPVRFVRDMITGKIPVPDDGPPPKNLRGIEMSKSANAVLKDLESTFGVNSAVTTEVFRKLPSGEYEFQKEISGRAPKMAELSTMFPEGGEFMYKIYIDGKLKQEIPRILLRSQDGSSPDNLMDGPMGPPPGASSRYDPRTGFRRPWQGARGTGGPFGGGDDGLSNVAANTLGKLADKAMRSGDDGSAIRIMTEAMDRLQNRQSDLARDERDRLFKIIEDVKQDRDKDKEEWREMMEGISQEQQEKERQTLEMIRQMMERDRERDKQAAEERLAAERERASSLLEQQKSFFQAMAQVDTERRELFEKSLERAQEAQNKIFEIQTQALEEGRRNNEHMLQLQQGYLEKIQALQASSQPWTVVSEAINGLQQTLSPAIQARINQGSGGLGSALGSPTGGNAMNQDMITRIKQSDFFKDEIEDLASHVEQGLPVTFKVNHVVGLMAQDPAIGMVVNYLVTRDLPEVIDGVPLSDKARTALSSPPAATWWTAFKQYLINAMTPPASQQAEAPAPGNGLPAGDHKPSLGE